MEIPEQLKQTMSSVTYPALAHSSNRATIIKKTIEEVLTNLTIFVRDGVNPGVKHDDRFDKKMQDIFKPFVKINTNSYSKLRKYVRSAGDKLDALSQ